MQPPEPASMKHFGKSNLCMLTHSMAKRHYLTPVNRAAWEQAHISLSEAYAGNACDARQGCLKYFKPKQQPVLACQLPCLTDKHLEMIGAIHRIPRLRCATCYYMLLHAVRSYY
jgi:hypothetical protein